MANQLSRDILYIKTIYLAALLELFLTKVLINLNSNCF